MIVRRVVAERTGPHERAGAPAQRRARQQDAAHDAVEVFDEVVVGEVVAASGERAQPLERVAPDALRRVADDVDPRFAIDVDVGRLVGRGPRPAVDALELRGDRRRSFELVHRTPQQIGLGRRDLRETPTPFDTGIAAKGRIADGGVGLRSAIHAPFGERYAGGA